MRTSTPVHIDQQRKAFGQRALTRRLARTIFVGSAATLRSAHKGIEQQRIYLGVAMPGDTVGNFALDTRGSSQRTNRNMLVFLAADAKRLTELDEAVREYLAWSSITGRIEELNLSHQQATQARSRESNADRAVAMRIAGTYHWALVPVQPNADRPVEWEVVKAEGSKERLAERTSDKLRQSDLLRVVQGARVVRQDLDRWLRSVWDCGHIRVGKLWSYYCRYPYLPRLRDRSVLDTGIRAVLDEIAWEHEGFALATSYDERTGDYEGLAIPHEDAFGQIVDSTLLVHPMRAGQQRAREKAARAVEQGAAAGVKVQPTDHPGVYKPTPAGEPDPAPPAPQNVRFFGVSTVNPERYAREFNRIGQEILPHLTGEGVDLTITVEIRATHRDGFPEDKVRVVNENARTLKFDQFGFENS